jgi:hypothetical protein
VVTHFRQWKRLSSRVPDTDLYDPSGLLAIAFGHYQPAKCAKSVGEGTRGSGHRHCALNVARPPSAVVMLRTIDHPLFMASFQTILVH